MSPAERLARFFELSTAERAAVVAHRLRRVARNAAWRLHDARRPSYLLGYRPVPLARRFAPAEPSLLDAATIRNLSERFLAHRFDLLGSGWVEVAHGIECRGLHGIRFAPSAPVQADPQGGWLEGRVNAANLAEAQRLWRMVSPGYRPIDWQLDFRSGFRWSESTHCLDIRFGDVEGADVKLPWELARLQHLPMLAHAYRVEPAERLAREFRDQVLDFAACNPPRFGVNWASSMDVALRMASLLAARDLFVAAGASFDAPFEALFARIVREHAVHVARGLDWHPRYRANHYLCGIAGLAFAAAYGPGAEWRAFAARELEREAQRQFLPDGGSFEASTGYHRLSGEALAYASALLAADLPPQHFATLARVARFVDETARPDGLAPQVGDQDSGRFLKLSVRCAPDAQGSGEEARDHRHLAAAVDGLFGGAGAPPWRLEAQLAGSLVARPLPRPGLEPIVRALGDDVAALRARLAALPPAQRARYEVPFPSLRREAVAFPHFGAYILRAADAYACIRCGPVGLNGLGAHAHNDALSMEIVVEGRDVARDPGSYLYTPLPLERDRYRSVRAHFAPRVAGREPGDLDAGLFRLHDRAKARCLHFGTDGFAGTHAGYGSPVHRLVTLTSTMLVIEDFSEGAPLEPLLVPGDAVAYSPGYGRLER